MAGNLQYIAQIFQAVKHMEEFVNLVLEYMAFVGDVLSPFKPEQVYFVSLLYSIQPLVFCKTCVRPPAFKAFSFDFTWKKLVFNFDSSPGQNSIILAC